MPADIANDLQRIAEAASQAHGLDTVCEVSLRIITAVQEMKHRTSRLEVLTFFVSSSTISIAQRMRGMQDGVSETLVILLKQYETVLHTVFRLVEKYSRSWRITIIITAGIREVKIGKLELKMRRIRKSIFILLDEKSCRLDSAIDLQVGSYFDPTGSSGLQQSSQGISTPNIDSVPFISEGAPEPSAIPQVTVDLPGKIVLFENQRPAFQTTEGDTLSVPQKPKYDSAFVTNLTGRIKIVRGPLFAGGFCDIYTGELITERGSETVAMKMLRVFNTSAHIVKAKKTFRREVGVWCSLSHRHVLPFYGTCELDEFRLFMVSPWAEGGNSLDYLRRNPSTDRGKLLWETASALEYLHSGKDAPRVVHGDLKADNVLISASGDALLCDFGLSRYVEEIVSQSGSSSAGRAGGHARFMAPELLLPPLDGRKVCKPTPETDVFSFGCLMLQIYTECLPFEGLLEAQAIVNLANGKVPSRPIVPLILQRGLDDYIWDLITDCWKFRASERPNMIEIMNRIGARPPPPPNLELRCESIYGSGTQALRAPKKPDHRCEEFEPNLDHDVAGGGGKYQPVWSPPLLQLRPPTPPNDTTHSRLQQRSIGLFQPARYRIPPRIWAEIAYHIPRFHLRNWLPVSSFHRNIARRHIFHTINIYFGGDNHDYTRGLDVFAHVRQDAVFALFVKTLRIYWNNEEGSNLDTLKRLVCETLPALQDLQELEWVGFPGMQPDMVQELLSTHPDIQSLSLVGWHFDAQGVSGFRYLRKFTLIAEDNDGFADINEVRAVLDHNQDTLVHITLGASLIGHHSWVLALQSPTIQKLTHLDLVDTQISAPVLMRISFAQNLRSLTLHGTFEHPSAVNVMFGSDHITDGQHRLLPHLQAFRFIMIGRENEVDVALFESVLSFLRQRSELRRLDLGNCPWELVRKLLPGLSGLRVLRLRMQKFDDDTSQELVDLLPWGMLAIHVSVASSYQPADMALNVCAWHFARFPLLSILHLESEYPRSLLEGFSFRSDNAPYPWMAQVHSIADALPSLDFVGWHGVHYVVDEEIGLVKLQKSPTRRRIDGGRSVDLGSEDACWLERNDVPISYEM